MKGRIKAAVLSLIMLTMFMMTLTTVSAQATEDPSGGGIVGLFCLIYMCALFVPLIIIIIATVAVYNDATKLGIENPWLWGLLVFLTGLIGVIIYLAAIRPKAVEENERKRHMPMGYGGYGDIPRKDGHCHHCGKFVGATVGRCTYCGSDL